MRGIAIDNGSMPKQIFGFT